MAVKEIRVVVNSKPGGPSAGRDADGDVTKQATTGVRIVFDESMSDEEAEQFLAAFRRATREVTGKEPHFSTLAGEE